MKKIVLTGYMGSGKTTLAPLLAQAAGLPYLDLDKVIEQNEGMSVPEIFQSKGEVYFRKSEHSTLKNILRGPEGFVLATGGGTPCYAGNHELLKADDIVSVYLKTSVGELHRRLQGGGMESRPLLAALNEEEQQEYIAKHLFDRSYYYLQAKHIIQTDGKTTENLVNEIMSLF